MYLNKFKIQSFFLWSLFFFLLQHVYRFACKFRIWSNIDHGQRAHGRMKQDENSEKDIEMIRHFIPHCIIIEITKHKQNQNQKIRQ